MSAEDQKLCASEYLNSTEALRLANELAGWALRSKIAAKFNQSPPPKASKSKKEGRKPDNQAKRRKSGFGANKRLSRVSEVLLVLSAFV